ncbi:sulfatase [Nocardioides sp. W7]|uniref:sulfatase family protein n=1 Tax=Nocardioides sp. W7 TaxID=2931390 RepID=UPI001FD1BDF4|nr:sulfatase [Nocardioides sp. W7]
MDGWERVRRRPARALLATLAVGALAVTGIEGSTGGAGDPSGSGEPADPSTSVRIAPTPTPAYQRPAGRPNVLLVTVDDLAVRDLPYLPNVLRLMGKGGVAFADAIAPTPICVPARASLLTGQYAHNHGAVTVEGARGGYAAFDDHATLATSLQDAGYDTLFTGKYLNGYGKDGTELDVPPGWTEWRATIDPSTYHFTRRRMNIDGSVVRSPGYATDVMTRHAQAMIRRDRGSTPWFAWVNYVAPHVGGPKLADDPVRLYEGTDAGNLKTTVPAPEDRGRHRRVKIPKLPYSFPDDTSSLPAADAPAHRRFSKLEKKALRIVYQRRIEAAHGLDRGVEQLFTTLRATGQLDRTLVIFTSDNGFAVDAHNLNGKLYHWDDSLRIPVLMRGPGLPAGREVRTAVTNPDLAATILGVAGARPPRPLDGVDILPWVTAPDQVRVVPIAGWPGRDGRRRFYAGVRVGGWTYVRFRRGGEELYDRGRDPYEMRNLVDDPDSQAVLGALRRLTLRYRDCAAATCPQEFYPASAASDPTRIVGAG